VLTPQQIIAYQDFILKVPVSDEVVKYAVKLVRSTRPHSEAAPKFVREYVNWGAGPRASQFLILGAKSRALLNGSYAVSKMDIRALALPTLQHRVLTNFKAEAERIDSTTIISQLLQTVTD
jgi:MoxR-like ATPase